MERQEISLFERRRTMFALPRATPFQAQGCHICHFGSTQGNTLSLVVNGKHFLRLGQTMGECQQTYRMASLPGASTDRAS